MAQLEKWLSWYAPLFGGRFDFDVAGTEPRFDALNRGLVMTRGRFWVRVFGGHDLRRASGAAPTTGDAIVGRADGKSGSITTFPWIAHAADADYVYAVHPVGAGGVTDADAAVRVRAVFDSAGDLLGPMPNAPQGLHVEPLAGGAFRLSWSYDETGEEAAPSEFLVFNDSGSPGAVNYAVIVAQPAYRTRGGFFEYVSDPFSHDLRVTWGVRARSAGGVTEPNTVVVAAIANAPRPSPDPRQMLTIMQA